MELIVKMRCEDKFKDIPLNESDADAFAKSLGIKDFDTLSMIEKQEALQDTVDSLFNKPEYNNYHKFNRHRAYVNTPTDKDTDEPFLSKDIMDTFPDTKESEKIDRVISYASIIKFLYDFFKKKPKFADVVIAVDIDNLSIAEYAEIINADRTTVSKRYKKAISLLNNKKVYDFLHKM